MGQAAGASQYAGNKHERGSMMVISRPKKHTPSVLYRQWWFWFYTTPRRALKIRLLMLLQSKLRASPRAKGYQSGGIKEKHAIRILEQIQCGTKVAEVSVMVTRLSSSSTAQLLITIPPRLPPLCSSPSFPNAVRHPAAGRRRIRWSIRWRAYSELVQE